MYQHIFVAQRIHQSVLMRRPGKEVEDFDAAAVRFSDEPIDVELMRKQHDDVVKVFHLSIYIAIPVPIKRASKSLRIARSFVEFSMGWLRNRKNTIEGAFNFAKDAVLHLEDISWTSEMKAEIEEENYPPFRRRGMPQYAKIFLYCQIYFRFRIASTYGSDFACLG